MKKYIPLIFMLSILFSTAMIPLCSLNLSREETEPQYSQKIMSDYKTNRMQLKPEIKEQSKIIYTGGSIVVLNSNYSFEIPKDKLKALTSNGQFRYISCLPADIDKNVISFTIFEECDSPYLSLMYMNEDGNINAISEKIDSKIYSSLKQSSRWIEFGNNDFSNKIIESQQSYTSFFKNLNNTRSLENPATQVYYNSYTNTDGIIHDYVQSYFNEDYHGTARCENRIVDIVPKELFTTLGDFICIGREYGFYINTAIDYLIAGDYCNDVMVFDINYNSVYTDTVVQTEIGSLMIKPLFQFRYATRCRTSQANFDYYYYTNEDEIVVQHLNYEASNYYIANPKIGTTVRNANYYNYENNNYNSNLDDGTYFIQHRIEAAYLKYNSSPNYNPDDLSVYLNVSSMISKIVGHINSWAGDITDIIDNAIHSAYSYLDHYYGVLNQTNYYYDETIYYNNPNAQLSNYGRYIKSLVALLSSANGDYLTTRGGCYLKTEYRLTNIYNSPGYYGNPQVIYSQIKLDIYGPNSWVNAPTNPGPGVMGSASFSFSEDFSLYPKPLTNETASISFQNGFVFYEFVPTMSNYFVIETTGSYDTIMYLYNANGEEINYDDDSGNSLNSKIIDYFTANNTYYIKIKFYSSSTIGSFQIKFGLDYSEVFVNSPVTFMIWFGGSVIYKFTPTETKYYGISLVRTDPETDPVLYVYDSNMNQIAYNDDYIDEDPYLSIFLTASCVYYIKCQMTIDFYAGPVTLTVN